MNSYLKSNKRAYTIAAVVIGSTLGWATNFFPNSNLLWWIKIAIGALILCGLAFFVIAMWPAFRASRTYKPRRIYPLIDDKKNTRTEN